jgi:hypothetical protein
MRILFPDVHFSFNDRRSLFDQEVVVIKTTVYSTIFPLFSHPRCQTKRFDLIVISKTSISVALNDPSSPVSLCVTVIFQHKCQSRAVADSLKFALNVFRSKHPICVWFSPCIGSPSNPESFLGGTTF